MSFQIRLDPRKKAASRFILAVRAALQEALTEEAESGRTTKSQIAERLGIHRSAVTRRMKGTENLTLRTLAEMAWALGRRPTFTLERATTPEGTNYSVSEDATRPSVFVQARSIVTDGSNQTQPRILYTGAQ